MTKRRYRVEVEPQPFTSDRPTILERLGRLAGVSTYRVPVEGKGTSWQPLPAEHALCLALGMARSHSGQDIGPDVAFDMATGSNRHQRRVCEALSAALDETLVEERDTQLARRSRPHVATAAFAAYLRLVFGQDAPAPEGVKERDWDILVRVAERILATEADQAVWRAGKALQSRNSG